MNDSQLMPMQNMNTGLAMSTMVPNTIQPGPSGGYDFSNFPIDQNLGVGLLSPIKMSTVFAYYALPPRNCLV